MFFKGTDRRPSARQIAGEIDAIGGEFNAFTGKEYTAYYVKCAAEHRDIALDVIVDMLRNSRFDAEEIEREKGVIVEEMNMYFDTPRDFIGGVYETLLWGDQPLGRDIIGTKETIHAATRETFTRISIAGTSRSAWSSASGVGSATTCSSAQEAARRPRAGRDGRARAGEPYANGRVRVFTKQSDQAHLILGVPSYPIEHPDRYPLQVLSTVLGGGMSSRLFTEVRERRGLAYRLRAESQLHRRRIALCPGGRRHQPDRRGGDDDPCRAPHDAAEPVPADSSKARNFSKGRFVLQLEARRG
jgi:predicted Zn-dependent peptidase